jgi:hypothetical protein
LKKSGSPEKETKKSVGLETHACIFVAHGLFVFSYTATFYRWQDDT